MAWWTEDGGLCPFCSWGGSGEGRRGEQLKQPYHINKTGEEVPFLRRHWTTEGRSQLAPLPGPPGTPVPRDGGPWLEGPRAGCLPRSAGVLSRRGRATAKMLWPEPPACREGRRLVSEAARAGARGQRKTRQGWYLPVPRPCSPQATCRPHLGAPAIWDLKYLCLPLGGRPGEALWALGCGGCPARSASSNKSQRPSCAIHGRASPGSPHRPADLGKINLISTCGRRPRTPTGLGLIILPPPMPRNLICPGI